MALPRTSLRGFLSHARYTLQTAASKKSSVTFVVGNESADLDSICSTIIYSYIASISPTSSTKPAVFHIPLLNLPRADIALRPELLALLPKANIGKEHLITLDDLGDESTLESRFPAAETRWILVDHNALQGKLGQIYGKRVVGTIDHHVDEGTVPRDTDDEPRIITPCGSCSSLVVNRFRQAWDLWALYVSFSGAANGQGDNLIEDGSFATLWDAQVAHLALAAVLIDTTNLEDKHKTTPQDREAVAYLEAKINMSPKLGRTYARQDFFDLISKAKQDLDGLSVRDVLRKDYKQWTENGLVLGISSVVRSHSYLESKARNQASGDNNLAKEIASYATDKSLDVACVLTAFVSDDKDDNGQFRREMSLLTRSESAKRSLLEAFPAGVGQALALREKQRYDDDGTDGWGHVLWEQGDTAASRKQVAPLLRKAMADM